MFNLILNSIFNKKLKFNNDAKNWIQLSLLKKNFINFRD